MLRPRIIGLLLAFATLLIFLPSIRNGFVNYDDDIYVTQNPIVQNGFTLAGIKWAFTAWHASNWHPLTWLSHMADCELFRLNPAGHHFTSILFHAANSLLLFIFLFRLTAFLWPSFFVAALFAWHPLHVESVAWISERKDVLSTFFALLALLAYAKYAKENCRSSLWLALGFFAVGLMSKPMLVTLPFVMLLLDLWPLQRLKIQNSKSGVKISKLISEKIPFFALSIISCVITFLAQKADAVASLTKVPLPLRFENAITAYTGYLAKTFWPDRLCIFYPLPEKILPVTVAVSAAILIIISAAVWFARRDKPYLLVGWLWFLGTLLPVIGLVQVGDQAMADRYSYFPLIGIFLAAVFLAEGLIRRFTFLKVPFAIAAILVLASFSILTENQLHYWRDSETLFTHAIDSGYDSALARLNLGSTLEGKNDFGGAIAQYRRAAQLDPARHEIYNNIGKLLAMQGKPAEALPYCRESVRLDPKSAVSHYGLGVVLETLGNFSEATNEFLTAANLDSDYAAPHFQTGRILLEQGRAADALAQFGEALRIEPENFQMLIYTARVLASSENSAERNGAEAFALANRAVKLNSNGFALDTLAMACAENGNFDDATQFAQQALVLAASSEEAAGIRQRLELYREHQPWRESFQKN